MTRIVGSLGLKRLTRIWTARSSTVGSNPAALTILGLMTGHGFRGLASTILHEQGYNHDHIELQLAHAPRNEVSAAYNHALYLEPRAQIMQDWADFLERTQRGGKVLPFRGLGGIAQTLYCPVGKQGPASTGCWARFAAGAPLVTSLLIT